ncbi:hypothetical protein [Nocardia niigatensis]|uniref:hypothetical protein n=1 Tax=Nocardia niigatensis TaxID=209249 RepID=UPI00030E6D8F|nr:hypothetical protein [Nocardia niigatensis]
MSANSNDRYDPTGEAAIWQSAANFVSSMKDAPDLPEGWAAAFTQAARALENEARGLRQAGGMYYRRISGNSDRPAAPTTN